MRRPDAIHLVTPVWGTEHIGRFLEFAVPSQLAPGNLDALAELAPLEYHIYTREQDRGTLEREDAIHRLASHARIQFHQLPSDPTARSAHAAMSDVHADILGLARRADAPVVFLAPEMVMSVGSLASVARRLLDGARLILLGGLRVKADVAGTIRDQFTRDGVIAAPARELAALSIPHLHPMMDGYFWDSAHPSAWPAVLLWHVGGEGILGHFFHLHPLVAWPELDATLSGTIDDRFVDDVCSQHSVYVNQDSDEMFVITLDDNPAAQQFQSLSKKPMSPRRVGAWAVRGTGAQHRRQVRLPIRIHSRDLDDRWQRVEHEADATVSQIGHWHLILRPVLSPWGRARQAAAGNPVLRAVYRRTKYRVRATSGRFLSSRGR